jgi:hypothetical protein
MYISYQGQRIVHEERVSACLARAERRRLLAAGQRRTDVSKTAGDRRGILRALVGAVSAAVARP